jgi:hypothetical protein
MTVQEVICTKQKNNALRGTTESFVSANEAQALIGQ